MNGLVATLLLAAAVESNGQACNYVFPAQSVRYDLSSLRGQVVPFTFSSSRDYRLALCGNAPGFSCVGRSAAAIELVNGNTCISNWGIAENTTSALLTSDASQGIKIIVAAGSACPAVPGAQQYSIFNIQCDPAFPVPKVMTVVNIPQCGLSFTIRAAQGCGNTYTPTSEAPALGWYVAMGAFGAIAVYLIGGVAYNRWRYGSTGLESVPNMGLWRAIYAVTIDPIARRVGGHSRLQQEEDYEYAAVEEDGTVKSVA